MELSVDFDLPASAPSQALDRKAVLSRRPDYQSALVGGDVARAELALAKAKSLEDVAVKLFAERERITDAPDGLESNTIVGVGVSLPLPLRKKNEAAIASAEIDIEQRGLEADALAIQIENEVAVALVSRAATYEAAVEAGGEVLELADKNLSGFREAYATGQASFTQVQRAQEQKLELEKAALDLAREFHLADAAVRYVMAAGAFASTTTRPTK